MPYPCYSALQAEAAQAAHDSELAAQQESLRELEQRLAQV